MALRNLRLHVLVLPIVFFLNTGMASGQEGCFFPTIEQDVPNLEAWFTECECAGDKPTVYTSEETVLRNDYVLVWVDSGGLACPPYSWSLSGSGFHFENAAGPTTATTNADFETIQLWADGTACGAAAITVTDACNEVANASVREPNNGHWVLVHEESCGEVDLEPGQCNCTNCSTVVVGGYRYTDCWWGGTRTYRYHGPYCDKWPYTEDLSGTCCYCPGFYPCFGVVGLTTHNMWEWQCD